MTTQFNDIYRDKTILITGHTGFKGAWLTTWLLELGANVIGYSLPDALQTHSLFNSAGLHDKIIDVRGDIRDYEKVWAVVEAHQPEIIFHLAAEAIVRHGIEQPKPTFDINAGGTVNVLEAVRKTDCVRAVVSITTDKVYANEEWVYGYRENDRLGGNDPYSASKTMAELAIHAYRSTYFPPEKYADHGVAIAATRAGNVIGGGDFAPYRLVPDCVYALTKNRPIPIRTPHTVRPWQHVLVPLSGYLLLGEKLLTDGAKHSDAYNFAPAEDSAVTTQQLVEKLIALWGDGTWEHTGTELSNHETNYLRLSRDKAVARLNWQATWTWEDALAEIVAFTRAWQSGADIYAVLQEHIRAYVANEVIR